TWEEFLQAAERIEKAGHIPLALGGQGWQQSLLFMSVLIGSGGRDLYRRIYVDHDADAAAGEGVVRAFETMRALTRYVDPGSPNRKWNDTTMLVANGKAAMQVMGDWAKGEFASAGLTLGEDYGCAPAPGTGDAYVLVVDVFAFPELDGEARQAQEKLARIMMDPAVQAEFSKHKGALPARMDADIGALDACARMGREILADTAAHLPNNALAFSNDVEGQINDLVGAFWSTPGMTAQEAAEQFADIVANADF
ncbi:MAG TPA: ABC transporter substrate-binding protein, partial [Arenibaculum sp.]|nr:ABC transporter substrate-binding protein [Arenibaculum sp.]